MGVSYFPSIQSFFAREVKRTRVDTSLPSEEEEEEEEKNKAVGDGFTSSEINEVLDPSTIDSKLPRAYEPCSIMLLQPGARHYEIGGRVVNLTTTARKRQNSEESEGFWNLTVSDGSGIIAVNIHCRHQNDCRPYLGQRVTIWASFIGVAAGGEFNSTPCSTSISLGRPGTTHIVFHDDAEGHDLHRSPLGSNQYDDSDLPGLMTLQQFLYTGGECDHSKILVCVRSVGSRKTVRPRSREVAVNLIEVGVFDHTASTMLTLWGDKTPSASSWSPNKTFLLISMPVYKAPKHDVRDQTAQLAIGFHTTVEVDPEFSRVSWLRATIKRMQERKTFFVPFPTEEWNKALGSSGPERVLYTIAELEESIMGEERQNFTGKLNVMLLQTSLSEFWRLNTICCTECCGIPLAANKLMVVCKNCGTEKRLHMNPRVLKTFVDESGCLAGSELVWSEDAWTQLLLPDMGGNAKGEEGTPPTDSWHQILELKTSELRDYEEQLLYSRVTLTFGWSASIHRLCVLGVEW